MTSAFHTKWFKPLIVLLLLLGIPLSYADDLNDGLIAYWPLNGNANDASGNGHHGSEQGSITYVSGRNDEGQAANFDGASSISIPVTNDFKFYNQSISYSLWVKEASDLGKKTDSRAASTYLSLSSNYIITNPWSWTLIIQQLSMLKHNGNIIARTSLTTSSMVEAISSTGLSPKEEWSHLVGVIDYPSRTVKLYINGFLRSNKRISTVDTRRAITLDIGGTGAYTHVGAIDEVRIYNKALSEEQIKQLAIAKPSVHIKPDVYVEIGENADLQGTFFDADADGVYKYHWNFGDGNSTIGTINSVGSVPSNYTYMQEGKFSATLEITDNFGHVSIGQTTVNVVSNTIEEPCDSNAITIRSNIPAAMPVKIASWSMPFSWDAMRVPNENDWVLIQAGHTVLLPNSKIKVKGLCIEQDGILHSSFNSLTTAANHIELSAAMIHNKGKIVAAQGINGSLLNNAYHRATEGSDIKIRAYRFLNGETGIVSANGRGGDDVLYNHYPLGTGVLTALGGDGGNIELYPTIFINKGVIESGTGGNGDTFESWNKFVYGHAYGGDGGTVRILPSDLSQSTNTGTIQAGSGGFADGISRWMRYIVWRDRRTGEYLDYDEREGRLYTVDAGQGGNIATNLTNVSGLIQGSRGGEAHRTLMYPTITRWVWIDPTTMTVDENTRINSAENIVLFGGDDWTMDLRKLSPNAIEAEQNIILAVGENSTIDLRGVTGKVFVAKEKVTIYADNVLLETGVSLQDLVDAP